MPYSLDSSVTTVDKFNDFRRFLENRVYTSVMTPPAVEPTVIKNQHPSKQAGHYVIEFLPESSTANTRVVFASDRLVPKYNLVFKKTVENLVPNIKWALTLTFINLKASSLEIGYHRELLQAIADDPKIMHEFMSLPTQVDYLQSQIPGNWSWNHDQATHQLPLLTTAFKTETQSHYAAIRSITNEFIGDFVVLKALYDLTEH